jgi:hypothetical protein
MAEKKAASAQPEAQAPKDVAEPAPASAPVPDTVADAAPVPEVNPSETIPGGKYYHASGVLVNCWNQPIDETGKVLDETPLLRG